MMPVDKPYNGGKWSAARFRSYVISQLRRGKWPPKYAAISRAYVRMGANPKTGRRCKLHRCEECGELFAKGDMRADHIEPVVDPCVGFVDYNTWIERYHIEAPMYAIICKWCHDVKTKAERAIRTEQARKAREK